MSCLSYWFVVFGLLLNLFFVHLYSYKHKYVKPVYLDIKLYDVEKIESGLSPVAKLGIGLGVGAVAALGAPLVLAGAGFTAGGIVGGSIAATWQSTIGNVLGGTVFSALQSAGVIGLGATGLTLVTATGGAVGIIIAGGVKRKVPLTEMENAFKLFENEEKVVPYNYIERMLTGLDLNLKGTELQAAYTKATGRTYKTSITYEEFVRLFGVKVFEGEEKKDKLKEVFEKCVGFSHKKEIGLELLGNALESLGINVSENDIKDSYNYVSDSKNGKVSEDIFLKMCGFNVQKK